MVQPKLARKIVCRKLSPNFREATKIEEFELPENLDDEQVIVRVRFVGINASDINFTQGKYFEDPKTPFDCGFESVGEVVRIGKNVKNVFVGSSVAVNGFGAFADYRVVPATSVTPLPSLSKDMLALSICGTTASLALDKVAELGSKETVLVTAAAGGTGHIAVQLVKIAGNHVIGTCSSKSKADYLTSIGCDRVINYKQESVKEVLSREYPNGVDVVIESIGGEMFDIAVDSLAAKGRVVVIGAVSEYQAKTNQTVDKYTLTFKLIHKAASIRGFSLLKYAEDIPSHLEKLATLIKEGKLKASIDPTVFQGLEGVASAIEHMYERRNVGKVVVAL